MTTDPEEGQSCVLAKTKLYIDVAPTKWPIIYRSNYDIKFWNLEKMHVFDAAKWGRVYKSLKDEHMVSDDTVVEPNIAETEDLRVAHSKCYLRSLNWSIQVAKITEVPCVACLPNFLVRRKILKPFRYQTGGSILAGKLAMERGWAINLGGGFHHCSSTRGGGFCVYADITLLIKFLFAHYSSVVQKVMIIDLDAHQGNGHERDFLGDQRVYILDAYNASIYPQDHYAKQAIRRAVELKPYTGDREYLHKVYQSMEKAFDEWPPDFIVFNAGTDILKGDPLGSLSITPTGVIQRDELVFEAAAERKIPVVMLLSGGYGRNSAEVIAKSILNLRNKGLVRLNNRTSQPSSRQRSMQSVVR